MTIDSTQTDDLQNMLQRYADYNLWANQQVANWLNTASEEQLNQAVESSFSSLKETIIHIWGAEYLWLQVVQEQAYDQSPAKSFEGNRSDLLKGWLSASKNFSKHLKNMTVSELQALRPKSKGKGFTRISDMIQHCMNHSTYHRGQLITMGRQVGLDKPPRTDFIYYVGLIGE